MLSCLYAAWLPQQLAQRFLGHFQTGILLAHLARRAQHAHAQLLRDRVDKQLTPLRCLGRFKPRTAHFIFELIKAPLDDFSLAVNLQCLKRVGFDVASNRPTAHKFHRFLQFVKVHGPNGFA